MSEQINQEAQIITLDSLIEHVGETLKGALEKIEAPQEVQDLAENLCMLSTSLLLTIHGNGDDELVIKAIAEALPLVVKAGGQLFTPSGETTRIKGALLSE